MPLTTTAIIFDQSGHKVQRQGNYNPRGYTLSERSEGYLKSN